jgi:hypothetical protein
MGIAERKFQAAQILDPSEVTVGGKELSVMEGTLFYKRHVRRSCCHSKGCVLAWPAVACCAACFFCMRSRDGLTV